MTGARKPRVVVAGPTPPPVGGWTLTIQDTLDQLRHDRSIDVVHWWFSFTRDWSGRTTVIPRKLVEVVAAIGRLLRIRSGGSIDCLIFPAAHPRFVTLCRDLFLLPAALLCSKIVLLQFHSGCHVEYFSAKTRLLYHPLRMFYSRAYGAIVMTKYNRRDPVFLGIKTLFVVPLCFSDNYLPERIRRARPDSTRFLYVGHLCEAKGTPALLTAFAKVLEAYPTCVLELVGECKAPYKETEIKRDIDRLAIRPSIVRSGVLLGKEKANAFGRADLFIFPSIDTETFGRVLVEAMMWELPIVATDWRGNKEVLSAEFGGILVDPDPDLASALAVALMAALERRTEWARWGQTNRTIFTERYDVQAGSGIGRLVHQLTC